MPLRSRKCDSRVTSGDLRAPIRTGPPKPISISATRRRMSARRMRSPSSASATSNVRSASGGTTIASTSPTRAGVDRAHVRPSGEMSELGHDLARRPPRSSPRRAPRSAPRPRPRAPPGRAHPVRTIATRPERITYIGGPVSPARLRNSPAGNRRISPNRRTRSISAAERTGNIWWNRDARTPPGRDRLCRVRVPR